MLISKVKKKKKTNNDIHFNVMEKTEANQKKKSRRKKVKSV